MKLQSAFFIWKTLCSFLFGGPTMLWLKVLKIGIFRASFFGCVTWAVFSFFYLCSVVPRKVFGKAELRPFFQFALSRPLPLRLLDNNHIKSNLRQKVPLFSARKYILTLEWHVKKSRSKSETGYVIENLRSRLWSRHEQSWYMFLLYSLSLLLFFLQLFDFNFD